MEETLRERIIALYQGQHLSYRQVARAVGIHYHKVRSVVAKHGKPRSRSGCKRGALNPSWKDGRSIDANGYIRILMPHHPGADSNGRVKEHRWVMEQMLGRYLRSDEHVHHRDGDPRNNAMENLALTNCAAHVRLHNPPERMRTIQQILLEQRLNRTHCRNGSHPYTPENLYVDPKGRRFCRECRALAQLRAKARRKSV